MLPAGTASATSTTVTFAAVAISGSDNRPSSQCFMVFKVVSPVFFLPSARRHGGFHAPARDPGQRRARRALRHRRIEPFPGLVEQQHARSIDESARNERATRLAYLNLIIAVQSRNVSQQNLDVANAALRNSRARVQVGVAAPTDIVDAEASVASNEEALILAERIHQAFRHRTFRSLNGVRPITISIGIAADEARSDEVLATLRARADEAIE